MQPIVNWTCAKAPESAAQRGGEGGWGQHTWLPSKPDHPVFFCPLERLHQIQTGRKVICAPCVRRWFHQAVAGWNGHDLCSRLLGIARAHRQRARHHGNETAGLYTLKRFTENFKDVSTSLIPWQLKVWCWQICQQMRSQADRTDRLKTQSVFDSDPSILSHSDDCGEFPSQWLP